MAILSKGGGNWRAGLFDRLMPNDLGLQEEDKERLGRQGLLSLGLGLLTNGGGFGNALGQGIQSGLLAMNSGADSIADRRYRSALIEGQGRDPGSLREFKYMADGLTPEEQAKARKISLGLVPREVGAAAKPQEYIGRDGRRRQGFFDPNTRTLNILDDGGQWQQASPTEWMPSGMGVTPPPPANPSADAEFEAFATAANDMAEKNGEPPLTQQELLTVYRQMRAGGEVKSDAQVDPPVAPLGAVVQKLQKADAPQIGIAAPPVVQAAPRPAANPSLFTSRTPEEQEALTTAAREQASIDAKVNNAPRVAGAEAQVTQAQELAKDDISRVSAAREEYAQAEESLNTLNALDDVLANAPTGRPQEFYGRMASYFGAPAGSTYEAQQALVSQRVNDILNAAKGPQTDQDAARARAAVPSMATSPAARKVVMDYLRKSGQIKREAARGLLDHYDANGNLRGYKGPSRSYRVDASPVGGRDPSKMSNEELLRSLNGR